MGGPLLELELTEQNLSTQQMIREVVRRGGGQRDDTDDNDAHLAVKAPKHSDNRVASVAEDGVLVVMMQKRGEKGKRQRGTAGYKANANHKPWLTREACASAGGSQRGRRATGKRKEHVLIRDYLPRNIKAPNRRRAYPSLVDTLLPLEGMFPTTDMY